jgi:hypothetical protein
MDVGDARRGSFVDPLLAADVIEAAAQERLAAEVLERLAQQPAEGKTESQYWSDGKVVTYFRCVVQLQMLTTRQPFVIRTVTTASGTQSSIGAGGTAA